MPNGPLEREVPDSLSRHHPVGLPVPFADSRLRFVDVKRQPVRPPAPHYVLGHLPIEVDHELRRAPPRDILLELYDQRWPCLLVPARLEPLFGQELDADSRRRVALARE